MFDIRGLTKTYTRSRQQVHALKDISLRIDAGNFVAVTGPSGSGKTTLLLSLGGLIRPSGGHVKYGNQNLYTLPASRLAAFRNRTVGFVLQTFNLVPYLTALAVLESYRLFLEYRRGEAKSYREIKQYKRRKRWLS